MLSRPCLGSWKTVVYQQVRWFSFKIRYKSVFDRIVHEFKQETQKDQELQANIKVFGEKLTSVKENKHLKHLKQAVGRASKEVLEQNDALLKDAKQRIDSVRQTANSITNKVVCL